jgi:hypothetical protein
MGEQKHGQVINRCNLLTELTSETGNTQTSLKECDEVGTKQKRTCSVCWTQQCESVSTAVVTKCCAQMEELTISNLPLFHSILLTQFLPVTIFRFIVSKLIPPTADQA